MDGSAILRFLSLETSVLGAVLISAVVSTVVAYLFRMREHGKKLLLDYEHEQRKEMRQVIGRFHGRLLNAANNLNHRFWNLYSNQEKGWLNVTDMWDSENYYLHSSAHRFLHVLAVIRQFEREAIIVDARLASERDLLFIKYIEAMRWCMTDVALFRGLDYDPFTQHDHFFSDSLRTYCDNCVIDGEFINLTSFVELVKKDGALHPVFHFFHALSRSEARLRWDRLVALHLLLVCFINCIGYEQHSTSKEKIAQIANQVQNPAVLSNLASWLPRHGIGADRDGKILMEICQGAGNAV